MSGKEIVDGPAPAVSAHAASVASAVSPEALLSDRTSIEGTGKIIHIPYPYLIVATKAMVP